MGRVVGFIFACAPWLVPGKKLFVNKKVVCFRHPTPSYDNHILVIPRKIAATPLKIKDSVFTDVIRAAEELVDKYIDKDDIKILCINGGSRQDVKQAHFHLFAVKNPPEIFYDGNVLDFPNINGKLKKLYDENNLKHKGYTIKMILGSDTLFKVDYK